MRKAAEILAVLFFVLVPSVGSSITMDDYLQQTLDAVTALAPKAYQTQERGYFIGGSASIRMPNEFIQPFSFTPPQVRAGCGGIDIVMGGFSYLGFDYLVQKLQSILQAAPAFAFQLALHTLCPQCGNITSTLDSLSDLINNLNVNSCQASKALAAGLFDWIGGEEQSTGSTDSWFSSISKAVQDFKSMVDKYAQKYDQMYGNREGTKTFKFEPSLLVNAMEQAGAYSGLTDFIRAYIGDYKEQISQGGKTPTPYRVPPCPGASALSLSPLVEGDYWVKDINGQCRKVTGTPLVDSVKAILTSISQKMEANGALTSDELSFIDSTRIPVASFLKVATLSDDADFKALLVDELAELVAYDLAYTTFSRLTALASAAVSNYESQSLKVREEARKYFQDMFQAISGVRDQARAEYLKKLKKYQAKYGSLLERYVQLKSSLYRALEDQGMLDSYVLGKKLKAMGF